MAYSGSMTKGGGYPFGGSGVNSLSYKVAHGAQRQDNVSIPVNQITKITRQAKDKDVFKQNKMLVPGYINPESVKALAKLSGMNPAEAKYKRPDSPSSRLGHVQPPKSVVGVHQSIAGGTYSTLGESVNYVSQRNGGGIN